MKTELTPETPVKITVTRNNQFQIKIKNTRFEEDYLDDLDARLLKQIKLKTKP